VVELDAVRRRSARVLALAPTGRVLLLRGADPARPGTAIWHAPGGGVEPGESDPQAAAREFREETGRLVEVGPLVWERHLLFSFDHVRYDQDEVYFLVDVDAEFTPTQLEHSDLERLYLTGHGWFGAQDVREVAERDLVAPPDLAARLDDLVRDGVPATPVRVGGAVMP
jgi:8-oxo-dGTP pyrophosphatase MutT (NUDIX family)